MMTIQREQLTTYMADHLPEYISRYDTNYFEFEEVVTRLSKEICAYGYRDTETGKWIRIDEAKRRDRSR
jgi:hypothetical protein